MAEPVVVVGHGAVTCLGHDMDATWNGLIEGRSGLKRCESLRGSLPSGHRGPGRGLRPWLDG